jgi:DNA-binding transcriptional ArsR family regulator
MILPDLITSTEHNLFASDISNIKKASMVLRAIDHKLRQFIIQTIHTNNRITVTNLFIILRLEQSVASQHLAILRKAGVVLSQRDGKFVYYSLNYARIAEIQTLTNTLVN